MYIQQFLAYLQFEKRYSLLTIESYKSDLSQFEDFLQQTEPDLEIELVQKVHVRNFIAHLSAQKLKPQSINRKISALKRMYKFLLREEVIEVSPLSAIKNLKAQKSIQIPYSEVEMNKEEEELLSSDSEFRKQQKSLIVEMLYQTGIRKAELINLKTIDFNSFQKEIKVLGKRNKERILPLSETLTHLISDFLQLKKEEKIESETLFCLENGKKLYPKFVYNVVNKYFSSKTTKEKKSPHMLRHTFATHLLNNGAEINSVKELLGHTSLASTQVYTHHDIQELKKVFQKNHPREQSTKK